MKVLVLSIVLSVVAAAAPDAMDTGRLELKTRLAESGLTGAAVCIMKHCDSLSDLIYINDRQINTCAKVPVKIARLKKLREDLSDESQSERKTRNQASRFRLDLLMSLLATVENFWRGFMLGCGGSFLYETLVFSSDFYAATDDLGARIKNAGYRALVIGLFAAFAAIGMAMFVPRGLRESFSTLRGFEGRV